jgi:very-short-patch-repair endonuclease
VRVFKLKKREGTLEVFEVKESAPKIDPREAFAKTLRNNPTESEKVFHEMLERLNVKFVFQPVLYGYIPDFYFPNYGRRIIEVDGSSHQGKEAYDAKRTAFLRRKGHEVLHIKASRVFWDLACIEIEVKAFLRGRRIPNGGKKYNQAKKQRPKYVKLGPDPLLVEFMHMTQGI